MSVPGNFYDTSTFANLLKRVFRGGVDPLKNFENPLLKKIMVEEGFVGSDIEHCRLTGYHGGYGFGSLGMPRTQQSTLIRPRVTRKKFYSRVKLDREAMVAAMSSEGAFKELVAQAKFDIQNSTEHGLSLSLFLGDADNRIILGTVASGGVSGSGTTGSPYVLVLTDAANDTVVESKFHVNQLVHIENGNSDIFQVVAVAPGTPSISVVRVTGTQVPVATDNIILQGSDSAAFTGLPAMTAASGTLYNVTLGLSNQWLARIDDQTGQSISLPKLYEQLVRVQNRCGKQPDTIVCGMNQFLKIASLLENKRTVFVPSAEAMKNDNVMGHQGLTIDGSSGPVDIIWDRNCPNSKIYHLNTDKIKLMKAPMSGMVDNNGSLLHNLHATDEDGYMLLYACYGDFFGEPVFQGVINGLKTDTE